MPIKPRLYDDARWSGNDLAANQWGLGLAVHNLNRYSYVRFICSYIMPSLETTLDLVLLEQVAQRQAKAETTQGAHGPPKAKQVLGPATMSAETRHSAMVAMGRLLEFMGCVAPIGHHLGDRCLRKVKVKLRAQIRFPASTGSSKARSVF